MSAPLLISPDSVGINNGRLSRTPTRNTNDIDNSDARSPSIMHMDPDAMVDGFPGNFRSLSPARSMMEDGGKDNGFDFNLYAIKV